MGCVARRNPVRIYLVRHGEAERKAAHPARPLTAKGRADVEKVARFAGPRIRDLGVIWHSDKTRARETAEIIARHVASKHGLVERTDLAPGHDPRTLVPDLASSEEDLMIVGHLPFLQKLAGIAFLDNKDVDVIRFDAGGLVCIEQDESAELDWRVVWMVVPDVL
jgi:phosphohistidine phosphatase